MANIDLSATISARATLSASASVKHSFYPQHLAAAAYFADQAKLLEAAAGAVEDVPHRAYVTGALISAAAALEAFTNELFLEASDGQGALVRGIPPERVALLSQLWPETERFPILRKFQVALVALGKAALSPGAQPYQDADNLVRLRNALVHYRPEWDDDPVDHQKLEARLRTRFPDNPLAPSPSSLWLPHRCLGAACAAWAVASAREFLRAFCATAAIPVTF